MLILAVDFDGTLVNEDGQGSYHVIPGAREALERFRQNGYHIVIHTCRIGIAMAEGRVKREVEVIKETLTFFAIPFDEIYMAPKMVADLYIDDRAIAFAGDWQKVARLVQESEDEAA